jgi:hypothetical protein
MRLDMRKSQMVDCVGLGSDWRQEAMTLAGHEDAMNENRLTQMSGYALVLGGIIGIVTHILHPAEPRSPEQIHMYVMHTPAAHVGVWFGVLLVLMGLPVLFARFSRSSGLLTLISLPLIFVGLALADAMHCPLEFGALPAIYRVAPNQVGEIYMGFSATPYGALIMIGGPLMILGMLLFVIGMWRSPEFARWPCWLVLISLLGMCGALAGVPLAGLMFAVAFYAAFGAYGAMMLRTNK